MSNIDESMVDDITAIIDQAPGVLRSDKNKMIAWLKKQVPKSQGNVLEDSYITPNKEFFQFIYDRLRYVHKENPNTDYMLSLKERISNMHYLEQSKSAFKASDWYASKVDGKIHNIYQSVDNVEPKFKVGDWIVENSFNGNTVQITEFEEDKGVGIRVWFSNGTGTYIDFLKGYHLWTIQDAKDGDVLAFKNNISGIIICKSPTDYDTRSYCRLVSDSFVGKEESGWDSTLLCPATKEQHNLLFNKMKEAGYEWDAEKKELRKIEKPEEKSVDKLKVSDELYEHIRNTCAWIDDALSSTTVADITDYLEMASQNAQSAFDMIEKQGGQKNKTALDKAIEEEVDAWVEKQVPKWSEEDEHHWMMCLECVEECATQKREDFSKTIDWLKSIKQSVEGEIVSKNDNKIIWLEDLVKMTKEDYMLLPKERLAEMLVARDNQPTVVNIPFQSSRLQCCEPGGICTNPFGDCINCPRRFGGQGYTITTSQTILKDEK